ncbi:hypothetical protein BDV29DRAFT_173963 [Aspergillus leporis]|uniref:Uncharacterized protein n=1 Tax=Aspergillus leporis TaxID=41062 RepID=A0A5N5X4F9_9EURO|nr:hypothetical protein BDV29DRAFT_173963 [Aspergillus leporis]
MHFSAIYLLRYLTICYLRRLASHTRALEHTCFRFRCAIYASAFSVFFFFFLFQRLEYGCDSSFLFYTLRLMALFLRRFNVAAARPS